MKATLLSLVSLAPAVLLISCAPNQGQVDIPVAPAATIGNPYGVPTAPGANIPTAPQYQEIGPINPPAVPNYPPVPVPSVPNDIAPVTPPSPTLNGNVHTIQKGDSLWGISRKYSTTVEALKTANGMTSDTIIEGRSLIIPGR
ncbi:MAG: hypothetical protein ACI9NQ_000085 [Paracoccaceae bacterium]|jgi:hypothetical protein